MSTHPVKVTTFQSRYGEWVAQVVVTIPRSEDVVEVAGPTARGFTEREAVRNVLLQMSGARP